MFKCSPITAVLLDLLQSKIVTQTLKTLELKLFLIQQVQQNKHSLEHLLRTSFTTNVS